MAIGRLDRSLARRLYGDNIAAIELLDIGNFVMELYFTARVGDYGRVCGSSRLPSWTSPAIQKPEPRASARAVLRMRMRTKPRAE